MRQIRVEDFESRATFSLGSVYRHGTRGWRYVPVHSFADEKDGTCPCVDCWCLLGEDVALLECWDSAHAKAEPGLYARIESEVAHWPKLLAVVSSPLVRAKVEEVMEQYASLGFPYPLLSQLHPGGGLVKLSDWQ